MVIIAAVDDNNGMMFNHRRQSQDKVMRQRMLTLIGDGRLWVSRYSGNLFKDFPAAQLKTDDGFLGKASEGEYCFVEDSQVSHRVGDIEKIILFKWNRKYPADLFFDIDVSDGTWELAEADDFEGSSHDKITMEVYVRANV